LRLREPGTDEKIDLTFIKERRLVAKLITIMVRDFTMLFEPDFLKMLIQETWQIALQNLTYMLPFYHNLVLFNDEADESVSDQDVPLEFQAAIAQLFSLLSTLNSISQTLDSRSASQ